MIEDKKIKKYKKSGFDGRNQVLLEGIRFWWKE
jgi:hypothetical protein